MPHCDFNVRFFSCQRGHPETEKIFLKNTAHIIACLCMTRNPAPPLTLTPALARQSLYPSMMIAYNLCYTTILGKFDPKTGGTSGNLGALPYPEADTAAALARAAEAHQTWQGERRGSSQTSNFTPSGRTPGAAAPSKRSSEKASPAQRGGGTQYSPSPSVAGFSPPQSAGGGRGRKEWNPRSVHVAPNTAGFCHPSLRVGVLPLMLREILETRVMIKGAMRRAEEAGQRVLARTLNARQFALKMISNVTYG